MSSLSKFGMSIGKMAANSGCSAATIRFYEARGLLTKPDRLANGRRVFGLSDLARLNFVVSCRDGGMSLGDIAELLALMKREGQPCVAAKTIVKNRLVEVRKQMARLMSFTATLESIADRCAPACCGPNASECVIFQDVA